VAGMAAAAGHDWTVSDEHFRAALHQAEELPHRLDAPEVRRFYAMMLSDRGGPGDTELAGRMLREAITGYRSIGMPRHETNARELLSRLA